MSRKTKRTARMHKPNTWRGPLLIVLVIGLAVALIALATQPASKVPLEVSGAPSLKVDQEQADLGNVRLGQTVSVLFELSNAGDQPLRFSDTPYVEVVEGC